MRTKICECGKKFFIPNNSTEREVFFQRENPLQMFFNEVDVQIDRKYLFKKCLSCSIKESLKEIFIFVYFDSNGKQVVNWEEYSKKEPQKRKYINSVMSKLGILSGDGDGNWLIMSQVGGCLNPKYDGNVINLYFTSPDDALEYARVVSQRVSGCHIMKIDQVIFV